MVFTAGHGFFGVGFLFGMVTFCLFLQQFFGGIRTTVVLCFHTKPKPLVFRYFFLIHSLSLFDGRVLLILGDLAKQGHPEAPLRVDRGNKNPGFANFWCFFFCTFWDI